MNIFNEINQAGNCMLLNTIPLSRNFFTNPQRKQSLMTQVTSNTTIQVAGQIMQQYASKQRFELCSDFRSRLSYNDPPPLSLL